MDIGISGATVEVLTRERAGTDAYNAPVWGDWEAEEVTGVLPQPGGTSDLDEGRPEGLRVDMTFHFPRTYPKSLKGRRIAYAGRVYEVVGDPQPYLSGACPGPWDRAAEAVAVDG